MGTYLQNLRGGKGLLPGWKHPLGGSSKGKESIPNSGNESAVYPTNMYSMPVTRSSPYLQRPKVGELAGVLPERKRKRKFREMESNCERPALETAELESPGTSPFGSRDYWSDIPEHDFILPGRGFAYP